MSPLKLINLKSDDITTEFVEWHKSEHSKNYSASGRNFTKENLIEEFELGTKEKKLYQYLIHHIQDNKNIGLIKIGPIDHFHKKSDLVAFIGNKDYLKKGYGAEAIKLGNHKAFEDHDIRKVHGPIVKSNVGAVKVYLNGGWIIEGVQKGHYLIDGKEEDAILVACFNPKYFREDIYNKSSYQLEDIYRI